MAPTTESIYISLDPNTVATGSEQFFAEWAHHEVHVSSLRGVCVHIRCRGGGEPVLTPYGKRCLSIGRT